MQLGQVSVPSPSHRALEELDTSQKGDASICTAAAAVLRVRSCSDGAGHVVISRYFQKSSVEGSEQFAALATARGGSRPLLQRGACGRLEHLPHAFFSLS